MYVIALPNKLSLYGTLHHTAKKIWPSTGFEPATPPPAHMATPASQSCTQFSHHVHHQHPTLNIYTIMGRQDDISTGMCLYKLVFSWGCMR